MFKVETILTPLLLSYVDKYVKNISPKDSQVSLWGGEVVFNKLDLRLDVLEQELQLPFTFINGHVHELRINVPWTKLGSEPVIITVNTFECILKLKDGTENNEVDARSDDSSQKKKPQRLEVEEAPPSFVQSLVTRILSNMNIICNNVILKYVEGDIVMSINVKSAQLHTANSEWERTYIDTTQTDLIIRKLISLIDVTICLDQRDASGKIETYQDPLLYRSMIEGRVYIAYDSLTSRSPSVSRFDFRSEEMELSVTDQQLPMLLRLAQLCTALYFGDLVLIPPKVATDMEKDAEKSLSEGMDEEQTWGNWAWSLVPSINNIWEDDVESENLDRPATNPVFHFAAHLHKALITMKVTETDVKSQKIIFRPIACANIEGLFLDAAVRHPDWASIQMGISAGQIVAVDDCLCKGLFMHHENQPILASAGFLGNNQMKYLDQSLFNELSPENQMQRRDYNYDWEEHFQNLTEEKMLERSPCCALDYFYHLTLPEDDMETDPDQNYADLEDSNLKERLMVRCVVGPCQFNVNGDFAHRLEKVIRSLFSREFEPYSNPADVTIPHINKHYIPTTEDVEKMEEFIPLKCYSLSLVQPTLRIFSTDHPTCDVMAAVTNRKKKKSNLEGNTSTIQSEPVIIFECNRVEVQQIVPMYAKRVVQVAVNLSPVNDHFLYHSQSHITGKIFGAEVSLANMHHGHFDEKFNIVPPFSCAVYLKELQHPNLWQNPFQPKTECLLEMSRFSIQLTWPQVLFISSILNSWYQPNIGKIKFILTSLPETAVSLTNEYSTLEFSMNNLQCKYSKNDAVHAAIANMDNCCVVLQHWVNGVCHLVTLFHGPETKEHIYDINFFNETPSSEHTQETSENFVKAVLQFPITMETCSAPTVFVTSIKGMSVYLDPALYDWIDYFPNIIPDAGPTYRSESPRKDEPTEDSAQSSTIPTESQSLMKITEEKLAFSKEIVQFCLNFISVFKRLLIEVQCESITIFLPTTSTPLGSNVSHLTHKLRKLFSQGVMSDLLVVNVPKVTLHSGTQKQNLSSHIEDIPIYTLEGCNLSQDLFPWTLTLANFSIYTLNAKKEVAYCINPLSISATIALNTELSFDKISKVNLCIHADNELLYIQLCDKQVEIIANIAQTLLDAASKLLSRGTSIMNLFALAESKDNANFSPDVGEKSAASLIEVLSSEIRENKFDFESILSELPKLTLWVQWTLPKLSVKLTSSDGCRLNLDFDELGLSLDVQEVYSKIKFTLTAFNWNHSQKDEFTNQFTPGPFKGIFFTCSDKLSKNINIPNPKYDPSDDSPDEIFDSDSSSKSKSSYNFLTINLTRALSKNVQRRWTQLLRDHVDELESKVINSQSNFNRYVSEIDIKIRSFDCVLWFPVLTTGFRIFEPLFSLRFNFLNYPIQFASKVVVESAAESQFYQLKWFNNNNLPLIYLNISEIRIFVPKKVEWESVGKDGQTTHDMLIFQTKKLSIASQVENPLSRIVLRSDILALAQQARIIHVPGSDVEDRQYQLDITGISFSSGSWKDLVKRSRVSEAPSIGSQLHTMGENPALEWNNKYLKPTDIESELIFLPLVCNLNIRVVAAPAIVYKQLKEDILVAGHSLEVNLTTDLDIYLSFKQLTLIYQVCQENILTIMEVFNEQSKDIKRQRSRMNLQSGASSEPDSGIEVRLDSGTDSELSTLPQHTHALKTSIIPAKVIIEQQIMTKKWLNQSPTWNPVALVPFEVLFTARGFAFSAYTDKLKRNASRIKIKKESKGKKRHTGRHKNTTDGYDGSEEEFSEEEKDSNSNSIIPIIFIAFSQPHAFLQCRYTESKLDMSCFDFVMKGSNDKVFIPVTATKILPSLENYTVNWIETKPGDVHSRTGIPPALITVSIKNFLRGLTDINVSVDRPWKLNLSILKYEQILDYIEAVMELTIKSTPASSLKTFQLQINKKNVSEDALSALNPQNVVENLRHLATFIRFIHFKTVQVVVVLETVPHKESAHVVLAWDVLCGNIQLKEGKKFLVDEISLGLCADNFTTRVSYNKKLRPLLQPCCANINCNFIWDIWSKSAIIPRICINMELEALMLSFGRESWLCLRKIESQIDEFLKNESMKNIKLTKKGEKSKSQLELNEQTWHDDLRVGRFQYIQDSDDIGLQPAPNEIVFCKEQAGQPASMTWCYPEPRALTWVEIYPVPFRATSSSMMQSENKDEVNCVLQYWDVLTRSYITCRIFQLSESQHCNLNLPHILPADSKQQLFISHKWRVILDYYDPDNESDEIIVRRSLVSPLALAACMRVDSYFNPSLIPNIQARLSVDVVHVNFTNHLSRSTDSPLPLSPFTFDDTVPLDQDFLVFTLQNTTITAHSWNKWHKLEVKSMLSCNILEYRALTLRTFIEPCSIQGQLTYLPEQKPAVNDIVIRGDCLFIYLGQSAMHTLFFAARIFQQPSSDEMEQLLLTHYVICNDTQETIRFGQVDTDENIVLHSRKMHAYSWRSHRSKQLLHVCVDGMKWKWCDVFGIDKFGVETRTMEQKGQKVTLLIKVKKFNNSQKQVIICGQLIFANRMDHSLEIKLFPIFNTQPEDMGIGQEKLIALDKQSSAASCLYEPGTRKGFQVRFPGENWSEEIHFPQKSLMMDQILIKVLIKKNQCLNFLCHFFTERIGSSCQILVMFAPLYIIQTHLPCQINLLLTTPKMNETQSYQVDGWGQEFQLHCPGPANVTHQVAFRLGPESDTSRPSLPISTNMISQVTKLPYPKKINIEEMTTSWISNNSLLWPYDDEAFEKKLQKLPPGVIEAILKSRKSDVRKEISPKLVPNIDLEVRQFIHDCVVNDADLEA